jgi:hypothetical protein
MGGGVADQETFEALLEERLNHEHAGKAYARYEILNFGVPGYTPPQELMAIEQKVFSFDPQAILYVSRPGEGNVAIRHLQERVREGIEVPYAELAAIVRQANIDKRTTEVVALRRLKPFSDDIIAWTYRRIAGLCRQRGILPVWVFLPLVTEGQQPDPGLFRLAEEAGFLLVDLSGIYEQHDVRALRMSEWDFHPNVAGNRLIASRLYEALLAQAILPAEQPAAHMSGGPANSGNAAFTPEKSERVLSDGGGAPVPPGQSANGNASGNRAD